MTTKLLLLIAALLLAKYTQSVSVSQNQSPVFTASVGAAAVLSPSNAADYHATVLFDDKDLFPFYDNTQKPNQEEEGGHHHLHFEYLAGPGGRRWMAVLIAKLVVVTTLVVSLLACFHHVTHMHIHLF